MINTRSKAHLIKIYKRKYGITISLLLFLFGILFMLTSLVLVTWPDLLGLPKVAAKYLIIVPFPLFSKELLSKILIAETGSLDLYYTSLIIYWGAHLSGLFSMLAMFFILIKRLRLKSYQKGLVLTYNLLNRYEDYIHNPSWFNRQFLAIQIKKTNIHSLVSPVNRDWHKKPSYKWLDSNSFTSTVYDIVLYLSDFQAVLIYSLRENKNIEKAVPSIKKLIDFFYVTTLQAKDKPEEAEKKYILRQQRLLESFAKSFSQLQNQFKEAKKPDTSKFKEALAYVNSITFIKNAFILASVAAFVMVLGVLFIKIDLKQAFIAWFSVTFGALAISLGITRIHVKKNSD